MVAMPEQTGLPVRLPILLISSLDRTILDRSMTMNSVVRLRDSRFASGTTPASVLRKILPEASSPKDNCRAGVLESGKIPRESLRENLRKKSFWKGLAKNVPSLQDNVKKKIMQSYWCVTRLNCQPHSALSEGNIP
jgi:hypothetical protein